MTTPTTIVEKKDNNNNNTNTNTDNNNNNVVVVDNNNNNIPTAAMSTSALESKLRDLREKSNKHSQILTQKLASSQSGQNLLHIGTSLSTLPPDLHSLLTQLHPVLSSAETTEKHYLQRLNKLVQCGNEIRLEQRKVEHSKECANLYQDLLASEVVVKRDATYRRSMNITTTTSTSNGSNGYINDTINDQKDNDLDNDIYEQLDHVSELERCAHTTLCLVQDLESSNTKLSALTSSKVVSSSSATTVATTTTTKTGTKTTTTSSTQPTTTDGSSSTNSASSLPSLRTPLEDDIERAQFLLKLASRIRRLESDTIISLTYRTEYVLREIQQCREAQLESDEDNNNNNIDTVESKPAAAAVAVVDKQQLMKQEEDLLLMIGHCMRGLALLGRGKEVENIFARVAIMPLIRSRVSMGRLDEGGSRGECAGLFSLLDNMATAISQTFGPVLRLAEATFDVGSPKMDVDLLTAGVWVPIATALMADAGIKMAIFSPGIASILQANYVALDTFLSELSERLLKQQPSSSPPPPSVLGSNDGSAVNNSGNGTTTTAATLESLYFRPSLSVDNIRRAQNRIYAHPKTADFSKKWNLPIYYQLRFGECCNRLNKAVENTRRAGWYADVFTSTEERAESLKNLAGFELPLFLELYDILLGLWSSDVILRPLTHRFLRGAVQMVGRTIAFIRDGIEGTIQFGQLEENDPVVQQNGGSTDNSSNGMVGNNKQQHHHHHHLKPRTPYYWGESEVDVASVAWELAVLETVLVHDYATTVSNAFTGGDSTESERVELRNISAEVLKESSVQIRPLVETAWNDVIVKILTAKCSNPLSAVKGVAATYRMTNRPPPTQASPYVSTILRPLKEFDNEFVNRTPHYVGAMWKQLIVQTVADRYSVAVEELLATVQRTEVALQNRRTRRAAAGGKMSDGDKVKLQVFLDFNEFSRSVEEVGVDLTSVAGITKLKTLTGEGQQLLQQQQQQQQNGR